MLERMGELKRGILLRRDRSRSGWAGYTSCAGGAVGGQASVAEQTGRLGWQNHLTGITCQLELMSVFFC